MCGRYASTRSAADLSALFETLDETLDTAAGSSGLVDRVGPGELSGAGRGCGAGYNVAPTDPAPLVRMSQRRQARVLSVGRWGLYGSTRMINARAETVASTRAYAPAFADRRALVPVDGWYEWRRVGADRQAYFLTTTDGSVLALAGLWARGQAGQLTFTVVTTAAAGGVAEVHERMPLLLAAGQWREWLTASSAATALLVPPSEEVCNRLEVRPVGPAVGNVRNDGPELIARVRPEPPADRLW